MPKDNPMLKRFNHLTTVFVAATTAFFVTALPARAQTLGPVDLGMFELSRILKLSDTDPRIIAARLINATLELVGIVALVMILLAGFRFLFSMGQKEKMAAAGATFKNAIIGLVIVLAAWSIVRFVIEELVKATVPSSGAASFIHTAVTSFV